MDAAERRVGERGRGEEDDAGGGAGPDRRARLHQGTASPPYLYISSYPSKRL